MITVCGPTPYNSRATRPLPSQVGRRLAGVLSAFRPTPARTFGAVFAPLGRRAKCDFTLRDSEHPGKPTTAVERVLVVQVRPRLIRQPPASTTRQPGGLYGRVQPRTASTAPGAIEKHSAASPDCIRPHFPVRAHLATVAQRTQAVPSSTRANFRRVVLEECGVPVLGTECRPALAHADATRPPSPTAPRGCVLSRYDESASVGHFYFSRYRNQRGNRSNENIGIA
jgi:hypothetical protein